MEETYADASLQISINYNEISMCSCMYFVLHGQSQMSDMPESEDFPWFRANSNSISLVVLDLDLF